MDTSTYQAVEFLDTQDQYSYNEHLTCKFKFNFYTPQEGDRIALFKLGWTSVKDYLVFEWTPMGVQSGATYTITFNKLMLPKDDGDELYQFCYISGENQLHGASQPFAFTDNINVTESAITKMSKDLKHLKEENVMLRKALSSISRKDNNPQMYDADIAELRSAVAKLTIEFSEQKMELDMLKCKLLQGGEEYKKLYLEKVKLEKKVKKFKKEKSETDNIEFDIAHLMSIPPCPINLHH